MNTIDTLSKADIVELQERLATLGFDAGRIDGIWGPRTAAAYTAYLASQHALSETVPIITPAPAKPWWRTRRAKGAVTAIAGLAALFIPALREVDTAYLIELIWSNLDHVDHLITAVGALATVAGTVWSAIGAARAKAPIDSRLVLPGVRLPGGVREPGRSGRMERLPADSDAEGEYWRGPRGPLDPE